MSEGLTKSARKVVELAAIEARQLGHPAVGTEHLLLGLLRDDGVAAATLAEGGARLTAARHRVSEAVTAPAVAPIDDDRPYTARAQRALDRAARFARQGQRAEVEPVDVLLGVLDVEGLGCQVLRGIGVDVGRVRQRLGAPDSNTESADNAAAVPSEPPPADQSPAPGPTCPSCEANLAETLAVRQIRARGDSADVDVDVAFCDRCGTALGAV